MVINIRNCQKTLKSRKPDSAIYIAEGENGTRAGFIHLQTETDYFRDEKHGYVSDLAVDKSFEGHGVGRLLLKTAEDWAQAKGYHLLALYAFAGNTCARQVYEKYGFQQEVIKYVKTV